MHFSAHPDAWTIFSDERNLCPSCATALAVSCPAPALQYKSLPTTDKHLQQRATLQLHAQSCNCLSTQKTQEVSAIAHTTRTRKIDYLKLESPICMTVRCDPTVCQLQTVWWHNIRRNNCVHTTRAAFGNASMSAMTMTFCKECKRTCVQDDSKTIIYREPL